MSVPENTTEGRTRIASVSVERQQAPLGIDETNPLFGWNLESFARDVVQISYRIRVSRENAVGAPDVLVWDSDRVSSSNSIDIAYEGEPLQPRTGYVVDLEVATNVGDAPIRATTRFETGMLGDPWTARWVRPVQEERLPNPENYEYADPEVQITLPIPEEILRPAQYLRQRIELGAGVVRARAYATAHGVYRMEINGRRVGDRELAPEWTNYHGNLTYQVYDVTGHLTTGANVLAMTLADGWWAGRVGVYAQPMRYGDTIEALCQIEVLYEDGRAETIALDGRALSHEGPIRYSDLEIGERQDLRLVDAAWSTPSFDDGEWTPVEVLGEPEKTLTAFYGEPLRIIEEFAAAELLRTPEGDLIIDAGRIITGHARVEVKGVEGDVVTLEYTQTLDESGNFFTNIAWRPYAVPTDTFTLSGGNDILEAAFTFRGFRFIRVSGPTPVLDRLAVGTCTMVVVSSDTGTAFELKTDNPDIDTLFRNTVNTHVGNMLTIPMDNPDRERAGWTGDFHAVGPSLMTTLHLQSFTTRWLRDMITEQHEDGSIPQVIPSIGGVHDGSVYVWGDVGVLAPWALYEAYGDQRILRECYELSKGWLRWSGNAAERCLSDEDRADPRLHHVWRAVEFGFGDWLVPSKLSEISGRRYSNVGQSVELMPTLYWAHSTEIMSKIATVLGETEDAESYARLSEQIKESFRTAFVGEEGLLSEDEQGGYVLAIAFDMGDDGLKKKWLDRLVHLIHQNRDRLDTGFLSTEHLLPVLTAGGQGELAHRLLVQEEGPSWMHMIRNGSTASWEMWSCVADDGRPQRSSFSQPGLTTVFEWMARSLAGIAPKTPGYDEILIRPVPGPAVREVEARFDSIHGPIKTHWRWTDDTFVLEVDIPANARARIVVDDGADRTIRESGSVLSDVPSVVMTEEDGAAVLKVGSGRYRFSVEGPGEL